MIAVKKDLKAGDVAITISADNHFAAHLLRDYAARCEAVGAPETARQAREDADRLSIWQNQHGTAMPNDPAPVTATLGVVHAIVTQPSLSVTSLPLVR
jgi:hypothetical protein